MPSIAKKRLLRKKFKKHLLTSIQKSVAVQAKGPVFVERAEQAKRTKVDLEMMKIIDSYLEGYGSYEYNLVSFRKKLASILFVWNSNRS